MPPTEPPVTVQIKRQALKQPPDIAQAIAASLENLELVVQPFDKWLIYEATTESNKLNAV
jgi:hypothetical protein